MVAQREQLAAAFGDAIRPAGVTTISPVARTVPLQHGIAGATVAQRAKLGVGGIYSAKKYVSWYFSGASPKTNKGDALREIYTQIGIDAESAADRRTKAKLVQDGVIDDQDIDDLETAVAAYLQGGKAALPPERKALSAETWQHIWRGDFNKSKKKPTGYHWKGKGAASWLVGTGTLGRRQSGFYEEQVQVRDDQVDAIKADTNVDRNRIRGAVKEDMSTFFPDNWGEAEVKDAVELRDSTGKITSPNADGVTLVKSGTTIFPTID